MSEENTVPDAPEAPETPDSPEVPESPEISFDSEPTSDDKLWSSLAYIFSPIIPIVLLLVESKKSRPFINYHSFQALSVGVVFIIIVPIIAAFTFGCGSLIWLIMFYWAYKAYQGEYLEIPIITNFIKNQGWV